MTDKKPPPEKRQKKHQGTLQTGRARDVGIDIASVRPGAISNTLVPPRKPKPKPEAKDGKKGKPD